MKQTNWEFNYRAAVDSGFADDGGKNSSHIKMGPCRSSSSEPDTAGFSASAGTYFIGEACKKKKKELIFKVEC